MAVDADFASSLLEKVRMEDPWLPPRTWESIPSQSGSIPSSSSSSHNNHHLCDTSFLSEASLVRLALNALQGVASSVITIEKIAAAFCSDPADRTFHRISSLWNRSSSTHALGKMLKSIGCSGFLVFLLNMFVDYFRNSDQGLMRKGLENSGHCDIEVEGKEHPVYSLVNQAFAVAVEKVLEGYMCALDTLYASVGLRHSSKSSYLSLHETYEEGCLTSVVHSKITILEVYLHTKELRTQIEALGHLCNLHDIGFCFSEFSSEDLTAKAILEFNNFCRGGDLLTYLYTQLKVADPAHRSLLKFLFVRSFEPYFGFIRSWIFKAEINDPFKEFIVEYVDNLPLDPHDEAGTSTDFLFANIREQDGVSVPCFLKQFLVPLVRAGQQLQVLMKLLEFCNFVLHGDHTYMDLLPCWNDFSFSSNHPFYASSMTFSKGNIESMVIARNSYYRRMQEKLENILTKLEFSYQQVPCTAGPIQFGNGWSLKPSDSIGMNDMVAIHSVADERESNEALVIKDFDDTSTKDESFYGGDTSESSECSSLTGDEEKLKSEQLIKHPNSLCGFEQKILSALRFSTSTATNNLLQKSPQSERSYHLESGSHEILERTDALGNSVLSQRKGAILSGASVLSEYGESNLSCRDVNHMDGLPGNCWPLGSLVKNPFCVGRVQRNDLELHPSNSGLEVCKADIGVFEEGMAYFNKTIGIYNAFNETLHEDQPEKGYSTSNLYATQRLKLDYNCNILSINPMLTRNALFRLVVKPGERCITVQGQSLPYFDFSSVEDPFKVCLEKLATGSTWEIFKDSSVSAIIREQDHCGEQGYVVDQILIDKTKVSCVNPHLNFKDHSENVLVTNISGRSSWETLLFSSSNIGNNNIGDHRPDFSAIFDIPLDFIIDKCLLQEILLQYNYVSKLTIKLLEGFNLRDHLLALRRYHFTELADWADLFIMSLWHHKSCLTEADHRVSEIQWFLESSVQRSSCEKDHYKDRLFVYVKGDNTLPLSTSVTGVRFFDFLGLGYRVDWPINIVLTPRALKIYADIFSFLIQLKLAVFSLNDVWGLLKDLMHLLNQNNHSAVHERETGHFNLLMKLRHQLNHFVSTLQQYVHSQLSHVSWCKFLQSLNHKVKDMMDLESVHMAYLYDSLDICFLSDETRFIASFIEGILQCALDFRSCLTRGIWDIQLDQGDILRNFSRINISQVLNIKEKFNKNLKELRICYLKSPKHGDFGISRFWESLNYNEYYQDVGKEFGRYSFSI